MSGFNGTCRFEFSGDTDAARALIPQAQTFLRILLNDVGFQRLQFATRTRKLENGETIGVTRVANLNIIKIDVPERKESPLTGFTVKGFIVQYFCGRSPYDVDVEFKSSALFRNHDAPLISDKLVFDNYPDYGAKYEYVKDSNIQEVLFIDSDNSETITDNGAQTYGLEPRNSFPGYWPSVVAWPSVLTINLFAESWDLTGGFYLVDSATYQNYGPDPSGPPIIPPAGSATISVSSAEDIVNRFMEQSAIRRELDLQDMRKKAADNTHHYYASIESVLGQYGPAGGLFRPDNENGFVTNTGTIISDDMKSVELTYASRNHGGTSVFMLPDAGVRDYRYSQEIRSYINSLDTVNDYDHRVGTIGETYIDSNNGYTVFGASDDGHSYFHHAPTNAALATQHLRTERDTSPAFHVPVKVKDGRYKIMGKGLRNPGIYGEDNVLTKIKITFLIEDNRTHAEYYQKIEKSGLPSQIPVVTIDVGLIPDGGTNPIYSIK